LDHPINRAIVIGGLGFIGSYVTEELLTQNISTTIYDNLSSGKLNNSSYFISQIDIVEADILDLEQLICAMKGIKYVFHLAAITSVPQSITDPYQTHKINNTGTLNVLWAALKAGVSRVIISSSCSVYGDVNMPPLKETDIPSPKSPYAASKLIGETLAESFYHSYGLETVCLRYFNVYGLRQRADSGYAAAIPRFIQCYKQKKYPQIYGDGSQSRDFIHVTDVARANILAASLPSSVLAKHRVFNIGTGYSTSILKLLEIISNQAGYYIEPDFQPARIGDIKQSYADITLAKKYLKFNPVVNLNDGIKELIDHE